MIEQTAEEKRTAAGRANGASEPAAATPPSGKRSDDARPWWWRLGVTLGRKAGVLVLIAAAFGVGYLVHRAVTPASVVTLAQQEADSEQGAQFWTCAMHPTVKLPRPGKCPL